ncbi:MAG: TrmH family RNA methyltransferase [Candidatus Omnitrophota bacterium]
MKKSLLLYGKNSVCERLKANPASIKKIYLHINFNSMEVENMISAHGIPCERLPSEKLSKIKPTKDIQGIVAEVDNYEYIPFDNILENKGLTPIFLDRITDPHNLGVIIRTTACFGNFALVIPRHESCEVNETVLHVASGGENYTPVSIVTNLSNAIIKAKKHGYWIMGALVDKDAEDISGINLPHPLAFALGSEGSGIRYGVEKQIDIKARIPMDGAELSFNVNMACAIFCHEISRKRRLSKS